MSLLSGSGKLQAGELWRSAALQRTVAGTRAGEYASSESTTADRRQGCKGRYDGDRNRGWSGFGRRCRGWSVVQGLTEAIRHFFSLACAMCVIVQRDDGHGMGWRFSLVFLSVSFFLFCFYAISSWCGICANTHN